MKIQLSNFTYVDRPQQKKGKALRFALGISVPLVDGQKWELVIEGCLAFYDYLKVLRWSPPKSRWSPVKTQQLHWINTVGYNSVMDILHNNEKSKALLENLITPMQKIFEMNQKEKDPQNTDPNLPVLLEGEDL